MIFPHNINSQAGSSDHGVEVLIVVSGDEVARGKWLHDLNAAAEAFGFLIEITEENNLNPSERDQAKIRQLKRHASNLKDGIQKLVNIVAPMKADVNLASGEK